MGRRGLPGPLATVLAVWLFSVDSQQLADELITRRLASAPAD